MPRKVLRPLTPPQMRLSVVSSKQSNMDNLLTSAPAHLRLEKKALFANALLHVNVAYQAVRYSATVSATSRSSNIQEVIYETFI